MQLEHAHHRVTLVIINRDRVFTVNDHGNTNYGDTNYDDGGSDYDREADDDWDDGDSGYDD